MKKSVKRKKLAKHQEAMFKLEGKHPVQYQERGELSKKESI